MKKVLALILSLAMILCCLPAVYASETPYATIVTGSDFQAGPEKAVARLKNILALAKADGITVNGGIFGGDYANAVGVGPDGVISSIRSTVADAYPGIILNNMLFIEGNHDVNGMEIASTGLHDLGSYLVYSMNEDDYSRGQGSLTYGSLKITAVADALNKALSSLVTKEEKRPVFIVTHVPLHHTSRSSYADNLYSKYVFDVINAAAEKLDIVFLFGHNHSSSYDDYIGGSVNYITKGGNIRIPIPDTAQKGENGYTNETLNFTYMNCGYLGYSRNGTTEPSTNILTACFIEITTDKITVKRYSESGLYSTNTITRINNSSARQTKNTDAEVMTCSETTFISGVSELTPGMSYIIASSATEGECFAAKSTAMITATSSAYLGLRDEAVAVTVSDDVASITTTDSSVIYTADDIGGNIYLRNAANGLYLSVTKYAADSTFSASHTDIELVAKAKLGDSAVCTLDGGQLRVGGYLIHHSSSYYFYAKSSSATQVLYEGKLPETYEPTEPVDPVTPPTKTCNHICHKTGVYRILWMVINFVSRLFGVNQYCSCGARHW